MDGDLKEDSLPQEDQWRYNNPAPANPQEVRWTASEYLAHEKSPMWYLGILIGGALLSAAIYLISRDIVSVMVIILITIIFAVSASRKPRTLQYSLTQQGLEIGGKIYSYAEFRSFALVDEGAFTSVTLMPLKRFMPPIDIFYDPQDAEDIIGVLSSVLPMEEHKKDMVDILIRRLRF